MWVEFSKGELASNRMLKKSLFSPAHPGAPRRTFHHAALSHRSEAQRTEAYDSALRSLRPC
jgi:hypothetical protein